MGRFFSCVGRNKGRIKNLKEKGGAVGTPPVELEWADSDGFGTGSIIQLIRP
jgi:hypothetical protein